MTRESISSIATALVVGGGIGGMASAISLAERGVKVDLIDLDPDFYFSHFMAAGVYRRLKMYPEAVSEFRRAKELAPEQTWTDISFIGMLKEMNELDQARAIQDEILRRSESRFVPPYHIALVYNQLGDTEQALAWLEKAYQMRDPKMTFLKTARGWKKLESDPRYQDIYSRVFKP